MSKNTKILTVVMMVLMIISVWVSGRASFGVALTAALVSCAVALVVIFMAARDLKREPYRVGLLDALGLLTLVAFVVLTVTRFTRQ